MLGRKKTKLLDLERMAASALDAFLGVDDPGNARQNGHQPEPSGHRHGVAGGVVLGVALAVAARATYVRAKNLDLDQVAENIEERLSGTR
jgi:hypothetical protein